MRFLFALLALVAAVSASCAGVNSSSLANTTQNQSTAACFFIEDWNTTWYAYTEPLNQMVFLGDGDVYANDTLNLTVAEDITALQPINRIIYLNDGENYANATLNLTVYENLTSQWQTQDCRRNTSLSFGQVDVPANVSCAAFPALNLDTNVSAGALYQPQDARYNLTMRGTIPPVANLTCPAAPSCLQNENWTLAYAETRRNVAANITASCPAFPVLPAWDELISLDGGENYTLVKNGSTATFRCRKNLTLVQEQLGCPTKTNISGLEMCTDSIISFCGVEGLQALEKGDLMGCVEPKISALKSDLRAAQNRSSELENSLTVKTRVLADYSTATEIAKQLVMAFAALFGIWFAISRVSGFSRKAPPMPFGQKPHMDKKFIEAEFDRIK